MASPSRVESPGAITRFKDFFLGHGSQPPTIVGQIRPDVPEKKDADNLLTQMQLCLESGGDEAKARAQTVALGLIYQGLSQAGKEKFLYLFATGFDRDHDKIRQHAEALAKAGPDDSLAALEEALKKELSAPRNRILRQFLSLPEGPRFLVDMRADLLKQIARDGRQKGGDPELNKTLATAMKGLEGDLKEILTGVFDVGMLDLKRVTAGSPTELLEKVQKYEQVHAMQSPKDVLDLLNRKDRRIYAFFHPKMPDEPFLVLNVKFAKRMESSIQVIRDKAAPVVPEKEANWVLFDSISNPFAATSTSGLTGTGIANFLIKQVALEIEKELPDRHFATLSPIPDFRKWLEPKLAKGDELLLPREIPKINKLVPEGESTGNAEKDLLKVLNGDWQQNRAVSGTLEPIMKRLAAKYLLFEERGEDHGAYDSVANFHIKNGAQVERINWRGDISPKGMERAWGMTVNYLYNLKHIDENYQRYNGTPRVIMASREVHSLAERSNGMVKT